MHTRALFCPANQKAMQVTNELESHILVELKLAVDELNKTALRSQLVPPGGRCSHSHALTVHVLSLVSLFYAEVAEFDLVFQSAK